VYEEAIVYYKKQIILHEKRLSILLVNVGVILETNEIME